MQNEWATRPTEETRTARAPSKQNEVIPDNGRRETPASVYQSGSPLLFNPKVGQVCAN